MAATCLIYFFIEELVNEYKKSSTLILFMPFMIFDILIDNFQIYLYFFHNNILTQYFIWFLAVGAFVPLIIAYLGPNKNLKISLNKNEITVHSENEPDPPNLHIIQLPRLNPINDLSYAEIRVFTLLAEGNNCKEISEKLFVCQRTVYFHIKNLKDKLNISSTSRLSSFAFANRENLPKFNKTSYFDSVKK
jgi:DNA-binding CsgD family transcriptional regulator